MRIRDRIGGGYTQGGGTTLAMNWHIFKHRKRRKWDVLEIFEINWLKWHIFGVAGAENSEKHPYFGNHVPNFVTVDDLLHNFA